MNFHLLIDPPSINNFYIRKQFQTATNILITVHCNIQYHLSSFITWQRNGKVIEIDGEKYASLQTMTNRESSYSQYTLVVRDIAGVLERPTYTCTVGNAAGNRSRSITFDTAVSLSLSGEYFKPYLKQGPKSIFIFSFLLILVKSLYIVLRNVPIIASGFFKSALMAQYKVVQVNEKSFDLKEGI